MVDLSKIVGGEPPWPTEGDKDAEIERLQDALRTIATQALYEQGESREALQNIITACREVAQQALA